MQRCTINFILALIGSYNPELRTSLDKKHIKLT